jgi:hypothetical protein
MAILGDRLGDVEQLLADDERFVERHIKHLHDFFILGYLL